MFNKEVTLEDLKREVEEIALRGLSNRGSYKGIRVENGKLLIQLLRGSNVDENVFIAHVQDGECILYNKDKSVRLNISNGRFLRSQKHGDKVFYGTLQEYNNGNYYK